MRVASIFFLLCVFFASAVFPPGVYAVPAKPVTAHVPPGMANFTPTGQLPGKTVLNLAIGLPVRDQAGLNVFLQALYNPASPQYRHYVSPAQFTDRFGPTAGDYEKVIQFAKASGFTVTATHADRMLLEVSAASEDVERAFHFKMLLYPHPTEKREFFAPDSEPVMPPGVPILDISGLNNYLSPRPKNFHRRIIKETAENTSREGSGPNGNLIGSDYRVAYVPGVTNTGKGQSVGLYEWDNFYPSDITSYESKAKMTNPPPVQTVKLNGYTGTQGDADGEVALDVEMAMSLAPGLTSIVCFEANTNTQPNVILSAMAAATNILQFSCSWYFPYNPQPTMDQYLEEFAAQGQSFYAASGDYGAFAPGSIPDPDDVPYITIVGGTALLTCNSNGPRANEFTWNAPDLFDASSGGISGNYGLPTWQNGVATAANMASTSARNTPDVAMVADNVFIVADDGQLETSGGTSAAAPLWAAFTALANQQAASTKNPPVGFINPAIYEFYTNGQYAAVFNDITYGNNTNEIAGEYNATPGYDLCTGLGSPNGGSMIIALASPDGFFVTPGQGFVASGASGGPFSMTGQVFTVTNAGSHALSWSLSGLPSWLTVSSQSGSLPPGAASTVSLALNASANSLASNVYVGNVWFTNLTSGLAQVRPFVLEVSENLVHDGGFETGDFAYWTVSSEDGYSFVDSGDYTGYSPYSGLYFATLGEVGGLSSIYQPLPTKVGQPYLISFYFSNPSGDPSQFVVEFATDTTTDVLYNLSNPAASGWHNVTLLTAATSTNSYLTFAAQDDEDYLILDDVSMIPIPFPNIQSVQATGSTVKLTFASHATLQYQIQTTTNLAQPWSNVGNPVTATGSSTSVTESVSTGTPQYFRVQLLNVL